jgi:hypothetical protein
MLGAGTGMSRGSSPVRVVARGGLLLLLAGVPGCGGDSGGAPAGAPTPSPPPNVRVSTPGNLRPEEVAIAIDPTDPSRLLVGSNLDWAYYSWDGGLSWEEREIVSDAFGVWGDPSVAFDSAGRAYFTHLSNTPPPGYWLDRIVVQRSTDAGASFDDGAGLAVRAPHQQDKSWIAADLTGSPWRDRLYVAWTEFDQYGSDRPEDHSRILFSYSGDAGATWSPPVSVSDVEGDALDGDNTVEGAVPAVGPDGEVYLAWGGPLGIVLDRSLDGGVTFGADVLVADQPGGWAFDVSGLQRVNGMPVTASDTSAGPHRGRVYVVWSDQRNGPGDTDVFLARSDDRGASWSPPVRVNDDSPGRQQFFAWASVDPETGSVYVVFYDRRDTAGDATDVFVARSTDGGASFENARVSESSFTPTTARFLGDYIGIAARGGRVHPVWTRQDGLALSVWTAFIDDRTFWAR